MLQKIWDALTLIIKLEAKVVAQGDVIKAQQCKIENLTERTIRLEAMIELLLRVSEQKRIQ